jgi:hypothetical protein
MKQISKKILLLIIIFPLYSCGTFSEAGKVLRNEKSKSTDEFLVRKRDALSLPPDYSIIPEPGSNKAKTETNNINKILKIPKETKQVEGKARSVEQSIINRINK